MKPILAITMGDPCGIGPEIIAEALSHADVYDQYIPLVVGSAAVMGDAVRITGPACGIHVVSGPAQALGIVGTIDVYDL